jgi:imidazoleglycerol phosphate synthase glutamine amidotransferase subunit HisH
VNEFGKTKNRRLMFGIMTAVSNLTTLSILLKIPHIGWRPINAPCEQTSRDITILQESTEDEFSKLFHSLSV